MEVTFYGRLTLARALALVLGFVPATLWSDNITLKDGRTIHGIIISVSPTEIVFRMENGSSERIAKRAVRRLGYSESPEEHRKRAELEDSIRREQEALRIQRAKLARYQEEQRAEAEEQRRLAALQAARQAEEEQRQKLAALETERARQAEEASKRKNAVNSLEAEIAKLDKEEEDIRRQEESLKKRREEIQRKKSELNPAFDPVLRVQRSALLPGWGQWTAGRYAVGGLYLGALLYIFAEGQNAHSQFRSAGAVERRSADYVAMHGGLTRNAFALSAAALLRDRAYVKQRNSADRMAALSAAAAAVYLWNLIDAYVFNPGDPATADQRVRVEPVYFSLTPSGAAIPRSKGLGVQVTFSF